MDQQVAQPYDITTPPVASYPAEYTAAWCISIFIAILAITQLIKTLISKRKAKKQFDYLLESFKDSSAWTNQSIRSGLAVITKTARRYDCDPELINKTEQILFMHHKDVVPEELRAVAEQLAQQVQSKLKEKRVKNK